MGKFVKGQKAWNSGKKGNSTTELSALKKTGQDKPRKMDVVLETPPSTTYSGDILPPGATSLGTNLPNSQPHLSFTVDRMPVRHTTHYQPVSVVRNTQECKPTDIVKVRYECLTANQAIAGVNFKKGIHTARILGMDYHAALKCVEPDVENYKRLEQEYLDGMKEIQTQTNDFDGRPLSMAQKYAMKLMYSSENHTGKRFRESHKNREPLPLAFIEILENEGTPLTAEQILDQENRKHKAQLEQQIALQQATLEQNAKMIEAIMKMAEGNKKS